MSPVSAPQDFVQVVILAAGMGTRLGRPFPKPLTPLDDGRSIHQQQVDNIRSVFGDAARVMVVVGFKHDLVMEANPDAVFVYNENYDQTNTSKSLLKALRASAPGGVVWLNGDVVFDPRVLDRLAEQLAAGRTAVTVNTSAVGDEEVKYTVDDDGFVRELSKTVESGLGEAVGINYVSADDKATLIEHLERCGDQDYFERGIETAVGEAGLRVTPVDISDLFVVEVDFAEDLERANAGRP
ncbi:MAG: NTP transferase domain-containing protein [Angustibacter sp.]